MEFVFVVPRAALFPEAYPHGFQAFDDVGTKPAESRTSVGNLGSYADFCARVEATGFFVERARAERNPEWKQIIPYTLVLQDQKVLCLKRSKRGSEHRLHDKLSIGVGGHLEPGDIEGGNSKGRAGFLERGAVLLKRGAVRELNEELRLELDCSNSGGAAAQFAPLGLINDDSNPVGAVHLGLVQTLSVPGPIEVRETELLSAELCGPLELGARILAGANFETWSALLIEQLDLAALVQKTQHQAILLTPVAGAAALPQGRLQGAHSAAATPIDPGGRVR